MVFDFSTKKRTGEGEKERLYLYVGKGNIDCRHIYFASRPIHICGIYVRTLCVRSLLLNIKQENRVCTQLPGKFIITFSC